MADQAVIRDWLKALGTLVAGSLPANESRAKLNLLAPMLAEEFPAGAFTPASLAAVARQCKASTLRRNLRGAQPVVERTPPAASRHRSRPERYHQATRDRARSQRKLGRHHARTETRKSEPSPAIQCATR